MSKKKPYSEIENGKALRAVKFEHAKMQKKFANEPEWLQFLVDAYYGLTEEAISLDNELHVRATADAKPVIRAEIAKTCDKKYIQLLEREIKAIRELAKVRKAIIDAAPAEPCKEGCQADCTECKGKAKAKK